jgi:hypothetical protein
MFRRHKDTCERGAPDDPCTCFNPPPSSAPKEDMYTLDEARKILRREQCLNESGHDLEQTVMSTYATVVDIRIHCRRCRSWFTENRPK